MSGKTQYAKRLARQVRRDVLIYDRRVSRAGRNLDRWRGLVFPDWPRFSNAFWKLHGCLVVIDDAAHVFREHRAEALPMLEEGRHNGHICLVCSQRYIGIDKTAREQASEVVIFRTDQDDAENLSRLYDAKIIRELAPKLPDLHYIRVDGVNPPSRGVVKPV